MAIKTPTAPKKMVQTRRMQRAMELRIKGYSYREIAREIGCAVATVQRDLYKQLSILSEETEATREHLRTVELRRLDKMIRTYSDEAAGGDSKAAGLLLRCIAERAKLLGLYASQKVEMSGDADGAPIKHEHVHEFERMSDEQLEAIAATAPTQKGS